MTDNLYRQVSDRYASLVWSTTPAYAAVIKSLPLEVLAPLVTCAFTIPHEELRAFLDSFLPAPGTDDRPPVDAPAAIARLRDLLVAHSRATYDPSNPADPLPPSVTAVQPASVASFPLRLAHTSSYLGLPAAPPPPPPQTEAEGGPADPTLAAAVSIAQDLRTVLVGDAAHTVHPLAGQGLNLGLADARSLSALLARLASQGGDLGAYLSLKPYARERYLANHAVLSACDHLASLYGRTDPVSVWARSTGVEVLNELGPVKDLIMRRAGSTTGRRARVLASLARGARGFGAAWRGRWSARDRSGTWLACSAARRSGSPARGCRASSCRGSRRERALEKPLCQVLSGTTFRFIRVESRKSLIPRKTGRRHLSCGVALAILERTRM